TFVRCGNTVSRLVIERSGPRVVPLTDAQLYQFDIPAPSTAETYHFRWSLYKIDISSRETTNGRTTAIAFEFGRTPFRLRVEDVERSNRLKTLQGRRYLIEVVDRGIARSARFDQTRVQVGPKAPSFTYRIEGEGRGLDVSSGRYRELFTSSIEASTIGILRSILENPGNGFPHVASQSGSMSLVK
ncbi:MAG: hypothetical protein AAB250_01070, partial [Bdellovibrionota bacterium]